MLLAMAMAMAMRSLTALGRRSVALAVVAVVVVVGVVAAGERYERALPLIFPPTAPTRIQWIAGIGIPLEDLVYEAMTTGYVLKAEYFLPDSAAKLRTKSTLNIKGRSLPEPAFERLLTAGIRQLGNATTLATATATATATPPRKGASSSYRWALYTALAGLGDRMGLKGRSCVLKSLCEAPHWPFHFQNGLFAELLHILLTPSSSVEALSTLEDREYGRAERWGRAGGNCDQLYAACPRSLLAHFSVSLGSAT